jgi:hypothetical protein
VELAVQASLICEEETAVAERLDGAAGGAAACVVALAGLEGADAPVVADAVTAK